MKELSIGMKVMYEGEAWDILHVFTKGEGGAKVMLGRLATRETETGLNVAPVTSVALENEIEEIAHEMTTKEYMEKLKAVFGNETTYSSTRMGICRDMPCMACPLNAACRQKVGFDKGCNTLILYHPDLAVKMMEEWQDKRDKPKRKTYLEDFREKMPNAYINPNFGTPAACRKRMYYHEIDDLKCGQKDECQKCWNEEMPEVSDNAEG